MALWLVGSGGGLAAAEDVPLPRSRPPQPPAWIEPHSFRDAAGPDFDSAAVTAKPTGCNERLRKIAVIAPIPRLIGPGACGGGDMVRLDAVLLPGGNRMAVRPAPYLRCAMAESLVGWLHDEAAPRLGALGSAVRSVETYDDFSCRGRNRVFGAKMSEHGKGNAVDIRGFTLADGRAIGLTDMMTVGHELRAALRETACARFTTVLGPGSDGYHEAHIHVDLIERRNGYRMCQWDVREPPKPKPESEPKPEVTIADVPLPQPRPAGAPVNGARKL